jgi:hypothetical protein
MGALALGFPEKVKAFFAEEGLLVETHVSGLLVAGLYASPVLFLGGLPTSLDTGLAAARLVLED